MEIFALISVVTALALALVIKLSRTLKNKFRDLKHDYLIQKGLIENMDMGFYLWDSKRRVEQFALQTSNQVFLSFDKFAEQFVEKDQLKKHLSTAKSRACKFHLTLSGSHKKLHFQCHGGSIVDDEGRVIGVVIFLRDDTQSLNHDREMEGKLEELENRNQMLSTIMSAAPYLVWARDHNLVITFRNQRAEGIDIPYNERLIAQQAFVTQQPQTDRVNFIIEGKRKAFQVTEKPCKNRITVGFAHSIEYLAYLEHRLNNFFRDRDELLAHLATAITIYSPSHKLTFFNAAFQKIFDLNRTWLETKPLYSEVMEQINKKLIVIYRSPNLSNILIPQSFIVSLIDKRNVHINIIPCHQGETIITYSEIRSSQKPDIRRLPRLALALFDAKGTIEFWNENYLHIFNLEAEFVDSHPHIASILEKAGLAAEEACEAKRQLSELIITPEKGGDPLKITTATAIEVWCTAYPLAGQKTLVMHAFK